ncbi:MAG: NfeD family protein [Candidatus Methanofastidiosia archaeon]
MKHGLPSKADIKKRFVVTYGIYILVVLILWAYVGIQFIYILPVIVVLCLVAYVNYRMNVNILTKLPVMSSDDFSDYLGIASSDIHNNGMVKIRGELWKARSDNKIPKGAEVKVILVEDNLVLYVKEIGPTIASE